MTNLISLAERVERRLKGFSEAVEGLPFVSKALAADYQFNTYASAVDGEFIVCVGPITDARTICRLDGYEQASMIAHALTIAAALRARAGGGD